MRHPAAGELLELHFGEAGPVRGARLRAHANRCAECRARLEDVAWAERLLRELPDEPPPADGLARVLARIEPVPAVPRAAPAWRAIVPSAAAVVVGALAVAIGGLTAAFAFLAAGSLVTLSLAPALILDAQRRGGATAAR